MDLYEAMGERHSVRRFDGRALAAVDAEALEQAIERECADTDLDIRLVTGEREAFTGRLATYGSFSGVANYLVLMGPQGADAERLAGEVGERLVLTAQTLGIGSCWVGGTYKRKALSVTPEAGKRVIIVVALGYPLDWGHPHKSKPLTKLGRVAGPWPKWFEDAVAAASLAPTAMNQQRFRFTLRAEITEEGTPVVEARAGIGPFTSVDLGIACCHFELGAKGTSFVWA